MKRKTKKRNLKSYALGTPQEGVPGEGEMMDESMPQEEVEGGEAVEFPDGEVGEFEGPSHQQGGIKVDLPEGTRIFSDKLKVKGKSLAERKIAREKKMEKLMKSLGENSTDKLLKHTIERTIQSNEQEEMADFQLQEFANILDGIQNFAYGTSREGIKKYANGTPSTGTPRSYFAKGFDNDEYAQAIKNYMAYNPDFNIDDEAQRKDLQKSLGVTEDGIFGKGTLDAMGNVYPAAIGETSPMNDGKVDRLSPMLTQRVKTSAETNSENPTLQDKYFGALFDMNKSGTGSEVDPTGNSNEVGSNVGNPNLTAGNIAGMAGTALSVLGPLMMTKRNRESDTKNINAFEDFGQDAINTNEEAQSYLAGQRANAENKLLKSRNASISRSRNSARGVNAQRAMDITADQGVNNTMADIYDGFAAQMMQLLGQKGQLENQRDSAVMAGEQQRDLADRQDKDNYYTQMGQNLSSAGTGLQKIGQDLNKGKGNKDFMEMLPDLSAYGLGYTYDKNGKLQIDKINK